MSAGHAAPGIYTKIIPALLCLLLLAGCDALKPKPYIFDLTRLNPDGSAYSGSGDYASQPWSCVRDNKTGFTWEVKTAEPGLQKDTNTYSWYSNDPSIHRGFAGKTNGGSCSGSRCDTESYIAAINAKKLCGFSDWHLPDRDELGSLVDISIPYPGPTIPQAFFPNSPPGKYWTETTFRTRRGGAWAWRFDYGNDIVLEKTEALHVRLVRGELKAPEEQKTTE